MSTSARARQRILAIFLPVAAVLYISCEALDPRGTDQLVTNVTTGLKLLAIASRHPTQLYVAGALSLFALGAVAVSYAAIALLVTGRGWVIATVAALLGATSAFCGAITNTFVGVNLAAAATAHATPQAAARFLLTTFNSGAGQLFTYLYFAGEFTAPVLMGFALWRSRRVPLWLAALFTIGFGLAEGQSANGPVVIAWMLPWLIAMILLAVRLWQAASQPVTSPAPPSAAEPVRTRPVAREASGESHAIR